MARAKRTPTPEPEDQSTALALPDTPVLIAAYGDDAKMEAILKRIETDALAVAPDLSTATSRKAIASLAFKVARSKTALDDIGKDISEEARKKVDTVNAKRKAARDRLDALKAKVRAPLDEWEATEAQRVADLEDRLRDFTDDLPGLDASSDEIASTIDEIEQIPVDDTWAEFKDRAAAAKTGTLNVLRDLLEKAKVREAERAELERLRAEKEAREEEDRRRQAEERRRAEAERIEREKAEAAERAAKDAREKAEHEAWLQRERAKLKQQEAEERHQRELAEAKRQAEFEVQQERNRQARIRAAEDEARAKADAERKAREADQARRAEVRQAIADSIAGLGAVCGPEDVAEAIMAGRIPHVKVEM